MRDSVLSPPYTQDCPQPVKIWASAKPSLTSGGSGSSSSLASGASVSPSTTFREPSAPSTIASYRQSHTS
ncbi:hypothetical protein [Cohnella rhizosphaerae]|uniref:Uncharacterized protein n=1 Tax=Cohnella rhizosphaerae TaxID=1457232 RepID=A0A9X4KVL2_9BACL|nr:hypothetical protein [Cohnella rhizosphaerae]MDG0808882.1 hypothetical protein [Cohnella rhizosphaerae]